MVEARWVGLRKKKGGGEVEEGDRKEGATQAFQQSVKLEQLAGETWKYGPVGDPLQGPFRVPRMHRSRHSEP